MRRLTIQKRQALGRLGRHLILLPVTIIWMIPIWMMFAISLRPVAEMFSQGIGVSNPILDNYIAVWRDNDLLIHFKNSLLITGSSVLLVMILASACAYAISLIKFRGSSTLFLFMLMTMTLPVPAVVVPLIQVLKKLNLLNTYPGLIGPYVALGVPFAAVIMKNAFDGFPKEIEEAACLDGCSNWTIFLKIVLPLSKPSLAVIAIWTFMQSWNEFILAMLTMTEVAMKPLILVPIIYNGMYLSFPGHLFAILSICTIPIIVFYLSLQKHFVSGLTAGAVKG
ncbi:MAG: carbohydrate ABC transporter permease [Firmicutes bacterium]|nr:carbohydrate ABC transporter permease [Bacillota bacterium]